MDDSVSRETVAPPVPSEARGAFPVGRLVLAERYAASLASDGVVRGLIGPREAPRLWERHLLNCVALADLVPAGATVCDIGSGAGLPGLVVAIARPDVRVTLVEPLLRRTTYLDEVVADLGLDSVTVVRGRAESLHGGAGFDVVTSRAVTALPRLLDWSMPLVAPGGRLLAMKGAAATEEVEQAASTLAAWGCGPAEVLRVAVGVEAQLVDADASSSEAAGTYVVRVAWRDPSAVSWPPVRRSEAATRTAGPGGRRSGRRRSGAGDAIGGTRGRGRPRDHRASEK